TSIGEEGINIPSVDHVIFYDAVPSAKRSIQRKGRTARIRPGTVVQLVARATLDETYYYSSLSQEKRMEHMLLSLNREL
ncbi:MAG: Hef nuclease, partial [Methanobacteriota archaeon]